MSEELLQVKKRIKDWEKAFQVENGRIPAKSDIKANKDIRKAYKTYYHLKEKLKKEDKKQDEDKSQNQNNKKRGSDDALKDMHPSVSVSIDSDEETENRVSELHAELGPTPQANGKVLSIFDMMISPPESSPLKRTPAIHSSPVKRDIFKTPTKAARKIELSDLTPSRGERNIMAKLREASHASPQKAMLVVTPTKPTAEAVVETPFYLGKVNNKFLFRESSTDNVLTTPTKTNAVNFLVSPSPLKPQRLMFSTRSVSELFNDSKNIELSEFEAEKLEIERELQQVENITEKETELAPQTRKRKVLTQKRTTRRWKIKPNAPLDKIDAFDGKDIHEEIRKLDENERKNMEHYMSGKKEEIETEEDEEEEITPIKNYTALKKPRLISDNFKRLKINDPRTKRFKLRMRRR